MPDEETLRFMEAQSKKTDKIEDSLDVIQHSLAVMGEKLSNILTQTTLTNGRVTRAETELNSVKQFIHTSTKVGGTIVFVIGIVWALVQFVYPILITDKTVVLEDAQYQQLQELLTQPYENKK